MTLDLRCQGGRFWENTYVAALDGNKRLEVPARGEKRQGNITDGIFLRAWQLVKVAIFGRKSSHTRQIAVRFEAKRNDDSKRPMT